jgi:hypothetical protein
LSLFQSSLGWLGSRGLIENQDDRERSLARREGIELVGDGQPVEANLAVLQFSIEIRDGGEQACDVQVAGNGFGREGVLEGLQRGTELGRRITRPRRRRWPGPACPLNARAREGR